jgi:hypothetical protein
LRAVAAKEEHRKWKRKRQDMAKALNLQTGNLSSLFHAARLFFIVIIIIIITTLADDESCNSQ